MKITAVIALLLAPSSNAITIRNLNQSKFPNLPSGKAVVDVVGNVLEEGKGELSRAMYEQREWCDDKPGGGGRCETWEDGLRRDISRANRDVVREFKRAGIDFNSANTYDAKFITDLIEAEYGDFVKQFHAHKGEMSQQLDEGFSELAREAKKMGLAQTSNVTREMNKLHIFAQKKGMTLSQLKIKSHQDEAVAKPKPGDFDDRERRPQSCRDLGWEREQCNWDKPELNACPGECCNRGPENEEERKAWDNYWNQKDENRRNLQQACMLKESGLAREVEREMPGVEEMTGMVVNAIEEVVQGSKDPKTVDELAKVIAGVNYMLLEEAARLEMTAVPAMPDPQDTANKIAQMIQKMGPQMTGDLRAMQELAGEVSRARFDTIKEVWQMEREAKREGINLNDPQWPKKTLKKIQADLAKGEGDRDMRHLARGINEMGGNTTQEEVKAFATEAIDSLVKLTSNPDAMHDIERAPQEIEHEIEKEAMREFRNIEEAGAAHPAKI